MDESRLGSTPITCAVVIAIDVGPRSRKGCPNAYTRVPRTSVTVPVAPISKSPRTRLTPIGSPGRSVAAVRAWAGRASLTPDGAANARRRFSRTDGSMPPNIIAEPIGRRPGTMADRFDEPRRSHDDPTEPIGSDV